MRRLVSVLSLSWIMLCLSASVALADVVSPEDDDSDDGCGCVSVYNPSGPLAPLTVAAGVVVLIGLRRRPSAS